MKITVKFRQLKKLKNHKKKVNLKIKTNFSLINRIFKINNLCYHKKIEDKMNKNKIKKSKSRINKIN